jgi:hypothetical protein
MLRKSRFCLLASVALLLAPLTAHAGVTMEFLAPSAQWSTAEKEQIFYLKANGGAISGLHCWVSSLTPERGDPAPRDSFTCTAPDNIPANAVSQFTLKYAPAAALKRSNYSAILQVLGTDQTGAAVSQTATFKIIVPPVALKIGETDAIRVRMVRDWPFSAASATISISVRVASYLAPTRLPEGVATQLYVQDGDVKATVPDGSLKVFFCNADDGKDTSKKKDEANLSCAKDALDLLSHGAVWNPSEPHPRHFASPHAVRM